MKIVADKHIPFVSEYFSSYGELILKSGREITPNDVKDADLLLVRSITPVNEMLLADSTVKFVGSVTAGIDHLDTHWLDQAGILWRAAEGFNAIPVADYVVSVVAALQRKQLLSFSGMKAAVIGVGHVGQLVVDRLRLLGFEVVQCDPLRANVEKDFQSVPFEQIAGVDLISLHVPLTIDGECPTYHMIDQAFLRRQKPRAVLLNASRGSVINSQALLQYGAHLCWCLDVWENEPAVDKRMLQNAFIATPHIAGYSVQSKIRGIDMIYRAACASDILQPQLVNPVAIPYQELSFSGLQHHWQDIVMGVFNPLIMSAMMRSLLLPAENVDALFDDMRNKFNYRHEFHYTNLIEVDAPASDKQVLADLGMQYLSKH